MPKTRFSCVVFFLAWLFTGVVWGQTAQDGVSREARDQGIQQAEAGDYRESYAALRQWLTSHPEDQEARFWGAWSAAYLGRTYEAAELLSGMDESQRRVQFLWGKLLLDKDDPQGAIETLEPLAQDDSSELGLEIRVLLVDALMAAGRAEDAVQWLDGRVEKSPALAMQLALAQYESGDVEGAKVTLAPFSKEALDRFGDRDPRLDRDLAAGLVYEYGRILVASAEHAEAVEFLEASVQLVPDCKQCWQQMAQAYAASGRREDAQQAQHRFEEILASESSLEEMQRQEALDLQDPTGKVMREAIATFEAGDPQKALRSLQAESRLRPRDPRILHLAARMLVSLGQTEDALVLANQAIQIEPTLADSYYLRGTVYLALQDKEQARQDFSRALEFAPDHESSMAALESLSKE